MATAVDLFKITETYFPRGLVAQRRDRFTVALADKTVEMSGAYLLANLLFWYPFIKRRIPIHSRYLFSPGEILGDKALERIRTRMYNDFRASPNVTLVDVFELQDDLLRVVNNFYNVYALELGAFRRSTSIFEIAEAFENPAIAKACDISDIGPHIEKGIRCAEEYLKDKYDKAMAVFESDAAKDTVVYPYVKLGIVSKTQISQVYVAGGCRTDVDDTLVKIPITDSYFNGLKGIVPFFIDSLSAKKSVVYNDLAMPKAQYSNRKVQLMASELRFIYPGDCGSRVYTDVRIHKNFAKSYLGMYICTDVEKETHVELTPENISEYFDTTVKMRGPMTCRYTDGYCHACGGRLAQYLPPTTLPGFISAIELMSTVSQLVLSNKHVQSTKSSTYIIPGALNEYFVNIHNEIFFRPRIDTTKLAIGIPVSNIEKIGDWDYAEGDINEQHFSGLTHMIIGNADTLEPLTHRVALCDSDKQTPPYLTFKALESITGNPDDVVVRGNIVWYRLKNFDRNEPLMRAVVVNDSTRDFVDQIELMVMYRIKNCTSCSEAIRDISNMVWRRTSPHILHLMTVIRSAMITNQNDYSIPVVEDPEDVMFAQLGRIIPRRSIGTQIGFERFHLYVFNPSTYIFPKTTSVFDAFLGPADFTGRPTVNPDYIQASAAAGTGKKVKLATELQS